ncbi:MAG: RNase P subunit p30 family protein [Candidatus Woesearchaeota archaeon]|nr:RNase P subunit p30 family protein [Candidatus Woesearchaeota archaeon]
MIDIIYCSPRENLGFHKILHVKTFNIVEGISEEKNRKAVENKQVDILLAPERIGRKDRLNQRDSGVNDILCKFARDNDVAIGFSFADLLNSKFRAVLLGRMMQNVRLCRKYKVRMVLASFAKDPWEMRTAYDLLAFGQVLGMTPKEATIALNFTKKRQAIKIIK